MEETNKDIDIICTSIIRSTQLPPTSHHQQATHFSYSPDKRIVEGERKEKEDKDKIPASPLKAPNLSRPLC